MSAKLAELIDKEDSFELLRDEIAAIIAIETANQKTLASAAGKPPEDWDLRVFVERSNPWAQFIEAPDQDTAPPIVHVAFESSTFDEGQSNIVERQKHTAIYNIDCYGYGVAQDDGSTGHIPGDERAALAAQRAVRLVRNILMSAAYTYLGHRGLVWRRWVRSLQSFQVPIDATNVQHVIAIRMAFEVQFHELSPQVNGEQLELISAGVKRAETGEIYFQADYDFAPDS